MCGKDIRTFWGKRFWFIRKYCFTHWATVLLSCINHKNAWKQRCRGFTTYNNEISGEIKQIIWWLLYEEGFCEWDSSHIRHYYMILCNSYKSRISKSNIPTHAPLMLNVNLQIRFCRVTCQIHNLEINFPYAIFVSYV